MTMRVAPGVPEIAAWGGSCNDPALYEPGGRCRTARVAAANSMARCSALL